LRVHQVKHGRDEGRPGFTSTPKRMGKNIKRARRKVYRGA
jgi:hypothetical protein